MKIGWLADYFVEEMGGGAEIADDRIIREGIRRGHKILKVRPKDKIPKKVKFLVLGNIDRFNIGELLAYCAFIPYVNFEHDLRMPRRAYYHQIAESAIVNVFHSPLHRDEVFKLTGRQYKHFLIPPVMSPLFKDLHLPRKKDPVALYVGNYSVAKGYYFMVEWLEKNPLWQIDHYGGGERRTHPRMNEMGYVENKDLVKIYNTYKTFLFLPEEIQAGGRTVAEAFMCKMPHIITNGRDGFTSWGWTMDNYQEARKVLITGHKLWWKAVEGEVKKW